MPGGRGRVVIYGSSTVKKTDTENIKIIICFPRTNGIKPIFNYNTLRLKDNNNDKSIITS